MASTKDKEYLREVSLSLEARIESEQQMIEQLELQTAKYGSLESPLTLEVELAEHKKQLEILKVGTKRVGTENI